MNNRLRPSWKGQTWAIGKKSGADMFAALHPSRAATGSRWSGTMMIRTGVQNPCSPDDLLCETIDTQRENAASVSLGRGFKSLRCYQPRKNKISSAKKARDDDAIGRWRVCFSGSNA